MSTWQEHDRAYFDALHLPAESHAHIEEAFATNDPVQVCGAIEGCIAAATFNRMRNGIATTRETTDEVMLGCRAYLAAWDAVEGERVKS